MQSGHGVWTCQAALWHLAEATQLFSYMSAHSENCNGSLWNCLLTWISKGHPCHQELQVFLNGLGRVSPSLSPVKNYWKYLLSSQMKLWTIIYSLRSHILIMNLWQSDESVDQVLNHDMSKFIVTSYHNTCDEVPLLKLNPLCMTLTLLAEINSSWMMSSSEVCEVPHMACFWSLNHNTLTLNFTFV